MAAFLPIPARSVDAVPAEGTTPLKPTNSAALESTCKTMGSLSTRSGDARVEELPWSPEGSIGIRYTFVEVSPKHCLTALQKTQGRRRTKSQPADRGREADELAFLPEEEGSPVDLASEAERSVPGTPAKVAVDEMSSPVVKKKMSHSRMSPEGAAAAAMSPKPWRWSPASMSPCPASPEPWCDAASLREMRRQEELRRGPVALRLEEMLMAPPRQPQAELATQIPPPPSVGSAKHATGQCNPCAFYWKAVGCTSGAKCDFCHLCDADERKRRSKEKKQAMYAEQQLAKQADAQLAQLPTPARRGSGASGGANQRRPQQQQQQPRW